MEFSKILRADYIKFCVWKGVYTGVETPITPDEPDVLDTGDGVETVSANLLKLLEN